MLIAFKPRFFRKKKTTIRDENINPIFSCGQSLSLQFTKHEDKNEWKRRRLGKIIRAISCYFPLIIHNYLWVCHTFCMLVMLLSLPLHEKGGIKTFSKENKKKTSRKSYPRSLIKNGKTTTQIFIIFYFLRFSFFKMSFGLRWYIKMKPHQQHWLVIQWNK